MGDFGYASRTVNDDFLITKTESGYQNQCSFEDYIQRINEEWIAHPVFIFLGNHPSQINVSLFKWRKNSHHFFSSCFYAHSANVQFIDFWTSLVRMEEESL